MENETSAGSPLVTRDRLFSAIVLIAGVFLVGEAFSYSYNSSIFLRVMAVSLALGAAVRLLLSFLRPSSSASGAGADSVAPAATVLILLLGYVALIEVVGFFLSTAIFCLAALVGFGRRFSLSYVLISLGIAAFIFALFFAALGVALPDSTLDLDRHLMIF